LTITGNNNLIVAANCDYGGHIFYQNYEFKVLFGGGAGFLKG
jgi:hypothetical protein